MDRYGVRNVLVVNACDWYVECEGLKCCVLCMMLCLSYVVSATSVQVR